MLIPILCQSGSNQEKEAIEYHEHRKVNIRNINYNRGLKY